MELVYLWVEDYKNIKKQGFNFSPNYECEFIPNYVDGKLSKESELKITPKENPLKDFFGKDINVTAIVGENGSGKSNVLECLLSIVSNKPKINAYLIILQDKVGNLIQYHTFGINVINTKTIEKKTIDKYKCFYSLFINNQYLEETILEKIDLMSEQSEVIRTHKEKKNINIRILENTKKYESVKFLQDSKNFFLPTKIRIKINHIKDLKNLTAGEQDNIKELKDKADEFLNKTEYKDYLKKIYEIYEIFRESDFYSKGSLTQKIIDEDNIYGHNKDLSVRYSTLLDNLNKKKFNNDIFYEFTISEIDEDIITFLESINNSHFFKIELLDDNKSFDNLSYGEQQLLIQLHLILYYFNSKKTITIDHSTWNEAEKKIDEVSENINIEKYFLFIDEFELGLHPNWQKKALSYMIDFFKIFDIKIDLFITSHSPFILSDIPKENVIFLEKDEKTGNCINASEKVNLNPFGANIHTLLSHGFFMKDGLMGEFAKDKIQSIIKYYEELLEKELTKEVNRKLRDKEKEIYEKEHKTKFWQIQSIIGDDYLKQVIKNHLIEIEKIVLGTDKAKQEEIKRLKAQIELLEN